MSRQYQRDFSERTGFKIGTNHEYGELFFTDDDYTICLQARALAAARGVSILEVLNEMGDHEALGRINQFLKTYMWFKDGEGDASKKLYDFLDMLTEYLDNPTPLPVEVVILDEAQDLSRLQWKIFRHMIEGAERVYIAGDDDQSIYNFIGAEPKEFIEFPATREIVLTNSYRVPRIIGAKADAMAATISERKEKHVSWAEKPGRLLYSGPNVEGLDIRDVPTLILCRHRRQVMSVSKKFMHIPHSMDRHAISNSYLSHLFTTHMTLLEGGVVPLVVRNEKDEIIQRPIKELMDYLRIRWSIIENKSEYSLRDLPELERIQPLWKSGRTGADRQAFAYLWYYWKKGYPLNVTPKLRIMTMHAAKGEEADDVFILTDCNETTYNHNNEDHERRLMYVALTRAKERCIICQPKSMTYMKGFF